MILRRGILGPINQLEWEYGPTYPVLIKRFVGNIKGGGGEYRGNPSGLNSIVYFMVFLRQIVSLKTSYNMAWVKI